MKLRHFYSILVKVADDAFDVVHALSIWIGVFTRYANIQSLDRKAVVELIDHIDVYEGNRIEITFKYEDECARAIKYIRRLAEQVELPMAV